MGEALNACPCCGHSYSGGGVRGLCPRCLASMAFAVDDPGASQPTARSTSEREPEWTDFGPELESASTLNGPPAGPALQANCRRFGDYELLEEIARGGMGIVFRARQLSLDRVVALKLQLSGQFASREEIARFHGEALLAAQLRHPNIVPVFDVGEANGQPFLTMEYVPGQNLADLVRERPVSARRAAEIIRAVAGAVQYAHEHSILHRDLKPSNVLLDELDRPRVADFGLAKRVEGAAVGLVSDFGSSGQVLHHSLTLTGEVLGSPSFIAPEQAAGRREAIGPASDVYSLGGLLYHLLTGRGPFQSASIQETLREVIEREPASPRLLNSGVPRDLETICLKCLEKDPRRRYASAEELAEELGRFLDGRPIVARPIRPVARLWRWCRRKPALATLALALHLVVAIGLIGILSQWHRAERHAVRETAERLRAEDAVITLQLQRAEDLIENEDVVMGLAYLARIVRQHPAHSVAPTRLLAALTHLDIILPKGPPLRHALKVNHAEFSPDGRRVVTASLDKTVRLWDASTCLQLGDPLVHSNEARYAHFSPDGRRLVTVVDGSAAALWTIAAATPSPRPLQHAGRVRTAQFSPDGRHVVTASEDGTARIWDAQTGDPFAEPLQHSAAVRQATFSPNGQLIVTTAADHAVRLWDARSSRPIVHPLQHQGEVTAAHFSPDSERLVTACADGATRIWQTATGTLLLDPFWHELGVNWAEFSPDGQRIATASDDGTARVWDAAHGTALAVMPHGSAVVTAQFSPDGQRLITGYPDNALRVWNSHTGRMLTSPLQHDGLVWRARFSPDGQSVVTASADRTARIWDLRHGRALTPMFTHSGPIHSVCYSPDGQWLATASSDRSARIWNVRTGRPRTPPLRHDAMVLGARFSPDGRRLLTASSDHTARLWDAATGQPLTQPLLHDERVKQVEFSPNGQWFLTTTASQTVNLWQGSTAQLQSVLLQSHDPGAAGQAHFSPDSQSVVLGLFAEDAARIVEVPSGVIRTELRGHGGWVANANFSPDSRRVVTASEDGTARIWDAVTGAPLTPPLAHKAFVVDARFSPDGTKVVTASTDTTARIWEVESGRTLTEPLHHRGQLHSALFSPGGGQVLTCSSDGTARLWDADTGRPLSEPIRHHGPVGMAQFSPDAWFVATASGDGTARICELPLFLTVGAGMAQPPPSDDQSPHAVLARLAEAALGQRLSDGGALEPVPYERLRVLRDQFCTTNPDGDFNRWLAWFLADRSTRAISPRSTMTVREYVAALLEQSSLSTAREAVLLAPTNAAALAHLADMLGSSPDSDSPITSAEADFLARRAQSLATGNP